jgi:geranylgeranyl diphosphate synthase, type I
MDFVRFRSWFDERFIPHVEQKVEVFLGTTTSQEVRDITQHVVAVAANGKRFRPFLAYIAHSLENPDDHFELYAAIELLHVFALIHDDIMDNATTRHSVACIHTFAAERTGSKEAGSALAILLGDAVFQWSHDALYAYTVLYPEQRAALSKTFSDLVSEVIYGQMLDILSPTQSPLSEASIIDKMYFKTARYSFIQPMTLGYIAAGIIDERRTFAEGYGRALGLLFQLQDDLLDLQDNGSKSSFVDIETKQQTIITWYMHQKTIPQIAALFVQYFGRPLSPTERSGVLELIMEAGAYSYVQQQIDAYYSEACSLATEDRWLAVANIVAKRSS